MTLEEVKPLISLEIKRRRQAAGLKQRELGELLGISRVRATQMESQEPPLHVSTLLDVCAALECTLIDFFNSIYGLREVNESGIQGEMQVGSTGEFLSSLDVLFRICKRVSDHVSRKGGSDEDLRRILHLLRSRQERLSLSHRQPLGQGGKISRKIRNMREKL